MQRSLRLPITLGALEGALLAVLGTVALSPLFLTRAAVLTSGEQGPPVPALVMSPLFMVLLAVGFSAVFGAITAYAARVVVPLFEPGMQLQGRPSSAVLLGAVVGAVLGVLAAFVGASAVGESTEAGLVVPILPALLLVIAAGAVFGSGTAVSVYALSEPVMEGPDADEVHEVRRRLMSAVLMPLVAFLGMAAIVVSLGILLLRFHAAAPILGMVVSAGILGFAALIASRPRRRVPVSEVLLALAGVGVVLLVIVAILSAAGGGEGHGEETGSQPSSTPIATSRPPSLT